MNVIEAAVLPLKADAIVRAEQEVAKLVARLTTELEAAGNDRNVAAPFPKTRGVGHVDYLVQKSRYDLLRSLSTGRQASHRPGTPDFADMDAAKIARFEAAAKETAAAQYDAFVSKLVAKIGEASKATLVGNHVWGFSILTVTTPTGVQNWKTQQIVNVSKLGLLFNQWPTRKVK